jgi:non-lysosomal glucosylceramidase
MAKIHIGNFYSNMFKSSQSVALHMRKNLLKSVSDIATWQEPFMLTTASPSESKSRVHRLPAWLNDVLINSVSFWRSAFWTKDGRWRQWEAYDCNDMDTIHNDMQRILPYMLFYPGELF